MEVDDEIFGSCVCVVAVFGAQKRLDLWDKFSLQISAQIVDGLLSDLIDALWIVIRIVCDVACDLDSITSEHGQPVVDGILFRPEIAPHRPAPHFEIRRFPSDSDIVLTMYAERPEDVTRFVTRVLRSHPLVKSTSTGWSVSSQEEEEEIAALVRTAQFRRMPEDGGSGPAAS